MKLAVEEETINDFSECLADDEAHELFWQAVYRKAFPSMVSASKCESGRYQWQLLGIDRAIQLTSGKTVLVDEKLRDDDYGDILLEFVSNDVTNSPGWLEKDLLIDYIAYAILPAKICYMLPWLPLKRSWGHFKRQWKAKYRIISAPNNGYKTLSVCVPTDALLKALKLSLIINVSEE